MTITSRLTPAIASTSILRQTCGHFYPCIWVRWGLLACLGIAVAACAASLEAYPRRPYDTMVPSPADSIQIVQQFYALPTEPQRRSYRDELIAERIVAINIAYRSFEAQLFQEGTLRNITTDWTLLGLAAAGATVSSSATQQILAAISGGLVGARAAFDKSALFDRALPALVSQMESSRQVIELRLLQGMQQDTNTYGIVQALGDLDAYFAAGTLPGAIMNIAGDAGVTKAAIAQQRTFSFASFDDSAKSLQQLIMGPAGVIDPVKLKLMRDCFPSAGVSPDVLNIDFFYGPEFAVERTKVLMCMRAGASPGIGAPAPPPRIIGRAAETRPTPPASTPSMSPTDPAASSQALKSLLQDPKTHALILKERQLAIACYPQNLAKSVPLTQVLLEPGFDQDRIAIVACMRARQ